MCPLCNGPLSFLGFLGKLGWFRCRNCGMDCSKPAEECDVDDSEA